jgi:CRP-like cAMP-binding protein
MATAIESATLMTWAAAEMEDLVMKRPRLAVALLQILDQRNLEFTRRVESLSIDNVERRLARSLIRFSERLGARHAVDDQIPKARVCKLFAERHSAQSRRPESVDQLISRSEIAATVDEMARRRRYAGAVLHVPYP